MDANKIPIWLQVFGSAAIPVAMFASIVTLLGEGNAQFLDEVKGWQTILSALIALVAAWWTITVLNGQRQDEQKRHEASLLRKKMAARAEMPDALSQISNYNEECIRYIIGDIQTRPITPKTGIDTLKFVIEHIDDDAAARTFELVSWYQIQSSRLSSHSNGTPYDHTQNCYDVVLLQAYTNSLFEYGRNRSQTVGVEKPSYEDMNTAAFNAFTHASSLHMDLSNLDLDELMKRRHQ